MWKYQICEIDYIWSPATCSCRNGKCLASIIDDSVIMVDEIIYAKAKTYSEEAKTIPAICNKKYNLWNKNFNILLVFLITIALMIAVIIYC